MTKEENFELEELSLKVFGTKYDWKKLTKRGLFIGQEGNSIRRMPLTISGAKEYMIRTLEMREKLKKDLEVKNANK